MKISFEVVLNQIKITCLVVGGPRILIPNEIWYDMIKAVEEKGNAEKKG